MQQQNNYQYKPRKNYQIKAAQVRLINSDGTNFGVVSLQEALNRAKEENFDLIEINPKAAPPVCKIGDYGKMLYEEKKKQSEEKKKQKQQELKEISFRPNTDTGDLNHKMEQAKGFLLDGDKVKFTVKFRGREITHTNLGREKIEYILQQLAELIQPNPPISLEGKFMSTTVLPIKQKV
jgi:translation initiation factor IF-3